LIDDLDKLKVAHQTKVDEDYQRKEKIIEEQWKEIAKLKEDNAKLKVN
jgi:hypothetical protein